jgi:hypothetical protein
MNTSGLAAGRARPAIFAGSLRSASAIGTSSERGTMHWTAMAVSPGHGRMAWECERDGWHALMTVDAGALPESRGQPFCMACIAIGNSLGFAGYGLGNALACETPGVISRGRDPVNELCLIRGSRSSFASHPRRNKGSFQKLPLWQNDLSKKNMHRILESVTETNGPGCRRNEDG